MNYYRRYLGDYARDTAHLSLTEHGVYTVLLDALYATEKPLPAEPEALYRICRAVTEDERAAVDAVVQQFFPVNGVGRMNARARREIEKGQAAIERMRQKGREGAERRWGKDREPHGVPHDDPNGDPNGVAIDPPSSTLSSKARGGKTRARRWGGDEKVPEEWISWAVQTEGATPDLAARWARKFEDYWKAANGTNARKLDWQATWRNWVRREMDSKPRAAESAGMFDNLQ